MLFLLIQTMFVCTLAPSVHSNVQSNDITDDVDSISQNKGLQYPHTDSVRRQSTFPASMQFPCAPGVNGNAVSSPGRSPERPHSVHTLRPGDIDVIGAMGDSLVAGSGALEEFALGAFIEYRGVSWCAGGQGTWRQYLTLPNILKEYNPNLTGYSTGTGEFLSPKSKMNVAFPVAAADDALQQAKYLVSKMRRDPSINMATDWKLITVFFGANDLCSAQCFNRERYTPLQHAKKLMLALDYLHKHMPRAFINLIPVIDPSITVRVRRTMMCRLLHNLFCTCYHRGDEDKMAIITSLTRGYQRAEEMLVNSGRYDTRDDFTVVLQPFMKMFNVPRDPRHQCDEVIDISYVTHDCFHFSQKGHALGANLLWNNMLQPVGFKSTTNISHVMESFLCPSDAAPYFFTAKNTEMFLRNGRQS